MVGKPEILTIDTKSSQGLEAQKQKSVEKATTFHPAENYCLRSSLFGLFVVKRRRQILRDSTSNAASNFGELSDLNPKQFDIALFGGAAKKDFT